MDPDNSPPPEKENGWTARSRATRQKLISAASKLIVEKGINSVSVVAVAQAAGVTRPGAYYHFKTREALLDAVRNETDHQLVRTVAGSKEDKYLYSQAAEFAAEDQDAIYLRIQRMLEQGPDDVIIRSRVRGIKRAERENLLRSGVNPEIAAMITGASLTSSFLAVSEFKQKNRRHKQAKISVAGQHCRGILPPKKPTMSRRRQGPLRSKTAGRLNRWKPESCL